MRAFVSVLGGLAMLAIMAPVAPAATLPAGFQESIAFSGLVQPTEVRFSSDGRVFVAEKSGLIKVFDSLSDTTPDVFADLRTQVHNYWDRGLLGLALDPSFPIRPYVYVHYAHDAAIGGTAPRWGTAGATSDNCPTPPGPTADGCVISGRISRLTAAGNTMTGSEQVLVEDYCMQFPSHMGGDLAFGADGALYTTGGDGASFNGQDYGQFGSPLNPCGDPPAGVGGIESLPTAEGGSLRSQDLRTTADPTSLDGTLIRINPDTGAGATGNPLSGSSDANAARIVAYGFRNPFRFAIVPGTNDVWVGDVGDGNWEEIDRVADPGGAIEDFGWPCYEGAPRHPAWDSLNLNMCENLYAQSGAVTAPYWAYQHTQQVVPGETCPTGSSSIAGLAFAPASGGSYPSTYRGALFFADYSRDCIWVMFKGAGGLPDPATRASFEAGAATPVDLEIGPGGELYYADLGGGTIRRISVAASGNRPPVAVASGSPLSGTAPLTVNFDGSGSSDPDPGDTITYAWDLDDDGAFDDATSVKPSFTYNSGSHTVRLRVTDNHGDFDTASLVVTAGNTPPTATIATPSAGTRWRVGDVIQFSGSATDAQDGNLAPVRLSWSLVIQHCPSNCHTHPVQDYAGVAGGSFTAPDHEYPSYLELTLTATDAGGLTDRKTVRLDPQTVPLTFASNPSGLQLSVGSDTTAAPFTRDVIIGSRNSVSAPSPQSPGGVLNGFSAWSDGGARSHDLIAPATPATYTAAYRPDLQAPSAPTGLKATAASQTRVDLSWGASSDDVRLEGYKIYRDGTELTTVGTTTAYSDTTARAGTAYSYEVRALDTAARLSGASNSASVTTPSTVQATFTPVADAKVQESTPSTNYATSALRADGGADPDVESYLRFSVAGLTGPVRSAKLRLWATSATGNGPAAYKTGTSWTETALTWSSRPARTSAATDDKSAIATGTWVEWDVTSLVTSGNAAYGFVLATTSNDGVDFTSREGTQKPQLVVTYDAVVGDSTPPTAPSALHATAVSATRVDLTWTAGSDANGVTANQIFRNGSLLTTVGAVTSFSDATTAPGTPYSYEVKAVDAAGNVSPASNTASVTTPAAGATLTFTATDDTYAQGDTPGTIYGSSTQVVVDNSPVRQMYLKFAVTGVGARPITSAKLRLHCVNGSPVGGVFHRIDPLLPWSESTLTWLTAPAIDSATVGALGSVAAGQTYDVPVTPLVTGDGTVAIGVTSANADGAYYDSKEGAAGAAPQLVVTTG